MASTIWKILVHSNGTSVLETRSEVYLDLSPGNSVVWIFDFDLEADELGAIVLTQQSGQELTQPFGPFTQLVYCGPDPNGDPERFEHRFRIFASGWSDDARTVSYQLQVTRRFEVVAKTGLQTAVFFAESSHLRPQEIYVTPFVAPDAEADGRPTPYLRLVPERTSITPGAPVIWNFELPNRFFPTATWYPEIVFENGRFGPFQAISVLSDASRGMGSTRRVRLMGTGDNGLRGSFDFECLVRSSDGKLAVSTGDPGIDDDGELMTPPP